jgi:hypothetical protein
MEITSTLFFFLVFPTTLFLIFLTKYMDTAWVVVSTSSTPKEPPAAPVIPMTKAPAYFSLADYDWNVNVFFKGLMK